MAVAEKLYGLFGGTFDPIHYGHLRPPQEVLRAANLTHITYIPAARPPHRQPHAAAAERLAMTRIALRDMPNCSASALEINRRGISYTADTVAELQHQHPRRKYVLLLGADALRGWQTWQDAAALQKRVHIIVMARAECPVPARMRKFLAADAAELRATAGGKILCIATTAYDISATEIRAARSRGDSITQFTPPGVAMYMQRKGLYARGN